MTISNFSVIQDSRAQTIGEDNRLWSKTFRTGGRRTDERAFLLLSVAGLTKANENPEIEINGRSVGRIRAYNGAAPTHWYTQMIPFNASVLERDADTDNTITIKAVADRNVKVLQGDRPLETFRIKDVLCFFQRDGRSAFDFTVIHGGNEKRLGEGQGAENLWRLEFHAAPGPRAKFGYLYCNIKGLTGSRRDVDVTLNGSPIGDFDDYVGQDPDQWFTQAIPIDARTLNVGNNVLELNAVGIDQDFFIKNVVCFYQDFIPRPLTAKEKSFFGLGIVPGAVDKDEQATVVATYSWMADRRAQIGDQGAIVWESDFTTPNRSSNVQALLMFTISGLTVGDDDPVVEVNGRSVGHLTRYKDADPKHTFTQMISIDADTLNLDENRVKVSAVGNPGGAGGDVFDDFSIRAAACFYRRTVKVSG